MAEHEYYRLNLVVEMQDRMRAALRKTSGTVEKFEQRLQRTRQAAQVLDQTKIEPIMRVKDTLTSQVLKADSLIKKLGMEVAAPVISAQDKFSAVAARIAEAVDAVAAGKHDIALGMKSGILTQIKEAEQAVKGIPHAELKGPLLKQLEQTASGLEKLDMMKVEPLARLRDHLTARTEKAEALINKLSLAQAAPVITVQDRVSSVVTHVNAALDALNKGKFDVVAEMKGPLIDEIVKARSALTALDSVKAGPIAELRGELFGQLTKAVSEARKLDSLAVEPKATLMDRVTGKARMISSTLRGLAGKTWEVTIAVKDKATNAIQKMTSAPAMLGMGGAALGTGFIVGGTIKKGVDFEAQMSSIKALAGLTGQEMLEVQNLAMQMGAKTKYSALEAAKGMEELLKAGLSVAQIKGGGLEAALNLATAGSLDLSKAAEIMSTSLNAYKSDGLTPSQAADILAGTANASASSVEELAYSLSQVSAVASSVGGSLRDTSIALGLFANNGLKGSDAGTSLKTFLSNLIPSTDEQIKLFDKLGITVGGTANKFYTAQGKLKSFEEIAEVIQNTFKDMTDMERQKYMDKIFGSDAIRAGMIIYKEGAAGVKKFKEEMSKVTALQVAKEKMNNAAGAVEQFKGALETLQISAMLPFLPTVKKIAEGAADLTDKIGPGITSSMENAAKKVEDFYNRLSSDQKFQNLKWGDKIVYVLEEMMQSIDHWVSGPGGQQAEKVFTKLAEIAMRAWMTALGGMAKGSADALLHGNIMGGTALAAGTALLGGGMVIRAGWGAGKGIYGAGRWARDKIAGQVAKSNAAKTALLETNPLAAEVVQGTKAVGGPAGRIRNLFKPATGTQLGGEIAAATRQAKGPTGLVTAAKEWFNLGQRSTVPVTVEAATAKGFSSVTKIAGATSEVAAATTGSKVLYGPAGEAIKVFSPVAEVATVPAAKVAEATTSAVSEAGAGLSGTSRALSVFNKVAKVASKVAMPLAVASELYDISKSENKAAAAAKSIGGLGGGAIGAKVGAAIGTAILPGIGTAVGAALGGMGGYFFGKHVAGEIVKPTKPAEETSGLGNLKGLESLGPTSTTLGETTAILVSFNVNLQNLATDITAKMSNWTEQAWNITAVATAFAANLQEKATEIIDKMGNWSGQIWNITAITTAFAANLQGKADSIIANGEALSKALAGAAARAEALSVPSFGSGPITAHAIGGILTQPHLGLVAEAGPEAIIPLSSRLRSRALELWQQTGQYLGVRPYAQGGLAGPIPALAGGYVAPIVSHNGNGGNEMTIQVTGDTYVHIADVRELDEDALALRIGRQIVQNIKRALENML